MRWAAVLLTAMMLTGCGGLGVPDINNGQDGISPSSVILDKGESVQFILVEDGKTQRGVFWSCSGGTIDDDGEYTAPSSSGVYEVNGSSGNTSGQATVLVN